MNYGRRLVPVIIDEAAKNTPERIYASIPKSADLSEGFKDINYRTFANAINRASFWLDLHLAKGGISEKFAYTGPKDLRYTVLTVAAIKTGREVCGIFCSPDVVVNYTSNNLAQIVLPSPFASLEAQLHVLDKTQCRKYLCPAVSVPLIKKVCALRPDMQLVVVPDWEEWLDEETVEHYVYDKSYEQAKEDTFMIVHTSGTTGLCS